MTDVTFTPGKYGRLPAKGAPALELKSFLTGVVPPHPVAEDQLARLSNWQMLGNDQYGDCVAVTLANVRRLVTAVLSTEHYMTLADVLAFYKTQNPNFPTDDNGMDIQTALEYLHASGGPDGTKAVAFAKVDHTNEDEVKAAIAIFGYVWVGMTVTSANEQQFAAGQTWTYDAASPVQGGHSVIVGGYGNAWNFETWAAETRLGEDFWTHQVEEAWVAIWPEHLGTKAFQAGVNLQQLAADYQAVTGGVLPIPTPPPVPTPTPPPVPTPTPPPVPTPTPTPTPPPVPTTITVPVYLSPALKARVDAYAAKKGQDASTWIGHLVASHFHFPGLVEEFVDRL